MTGPMRLLVPSSTDAHAIHGYRPEVTACGLDIVTGHATEAHRGVWLCTGCWPIARAANRARLYLAESAADAAMEPR